ncbi:MAG: hypothetical protein WCO90_10185, partial [Planctomycetota bacterium]
MNRCRIITGFRVPAGVVEREGRLLLEARAARLHLDEPLRRLPLIDDDHVALGDVGGRLEVVFHAVEGDRVAIEADVGHPGGRHK